ncbi:insulin-induced gene 1 protein [Erinaceus europaeus]|uniref:Insulin-induced gene protein n=1 Tax=Erinaceus europaeus TaxID=9365 RepID=A0A1S3WSY0_ERIEU|nr:insulin-induced gene 1 protein [Erinaceus europaeus]
MGRARPLVEPPHQTAGGQAREGRGPGRPRPHGRDRDHVARVPLPPYKPRRAPGRRAPLQAVRAARARAPARADPDPDPDPDPTGAQPRASLPGPPRPMPRLDDHFWSWSTARPAASSRQASRVGGMAGRSPTGAPGPSPPAPRTPPSWHHRLAARGLVLFSVGAGLALVLNLLQVQRHVALFPDQVAATGFSSAWWVPPCCGTAAAVVGLLYPCIDRRLGEPHEFKREWASVMRCVAVFVGINHASAKLDFANDVQLSLTLAALSLGLWWMFDRSRSGLGLGITIAFLATLVAQLLVYNGVYQYTSPDFLYIRSWLPCIFFSGGVTVGNIGRQLAMGLPEKPHSD